MREKKILYQALSFSPALPVLQSGPIASHKKWKHFQKKKKKSSILNNINTFNRLYSIIRLVFQIVNKIN